MIIIIIIHLFSVLSIILHFIIIKTVPLFYIIAYVPRTVVYALCLWFFLPISGIEKMNFQTVMKVTSITFYWSRPFQLI